MACLTVLLWLALGPYFHYSDSWELVINTLTTIITFIMVFLLQNTQNRDTMAIQLKLDEIIRSLKGSSNKLVKIEESTDEEITEMLKQYEELAEKIKIKTKKGEKVDGCPEIKD
jgi:low affinity Fe/Cu permease